MTDCTRCGDCCERIHSVGRRKLEEVLAVQQPLTPNPVLAANQASALFILAHWEVIEESGEWAKYSCTAFDPATRLCTAHESRPPVCSGFPWYGKEPTLSKDLHPRCSFNADVRTTLPIAAINGRST